MSSSPTTLPSPDQLLERMSPFRGAAAFIVPMRHPDGSELGNNGDILMRMVFDRILGKLDISSVPPTQADVVIVPPNGALLDIYQFPQILSNYLRGHRGRPVVIFPSSAHFPTQDPSELFLGRSAPTLWLLREPASFDHLQARWGSRLSMAGVELMLDHDVVAAGSTEVQEIFSGVRRPPSSRRPFALVAARLDREARAETMTRGGSPTSVSTGFRRRLVRSWMRAPGGGPKALVGRRLHQGRMDDRAEELLSQVRPSDLSDVGVPTHTQSGMRTFMLDVSSPLYASFHQYLRIIAEARYVITDRLHVALPAIVLGNPTVMVEAGYHKLGGVYSHSLAASRHACYIER